MKIELLDGLPFCRTTIKFREEEITLERVLLDTGSGGTIFSSDKLLSIGMRLEREDSIRRIRGVGGTEFVFTKRLERLSVGELQVTEFEIEVGAMNYGFELDGIIGTDFLIQVSAVIDLALLEIYVSGSKRA